MFFRRFFFALLFSLSFAAQAHSQPLKVTASILPLGDIAGKIGGGLIDVQILLKSGQSEHTYEPSPGDAKKLAETDVIIRAGFGMERWLEKLLTASQKKGSAMVDCSVAVKNPIKSEDDHDKEHGHGHDHDHEHGDYDPHYWLDPSIMVDVARLIEKVLVEKLPQNRDEIKSRTDKLVNELNQLDAEIAKNLAAPESNKRFVAFHNAWSYFAARYKLTKVGVIEKSPGREPSARYVAELVDEIKKQNVKAVLVEPQFPDKLGQTIANEAGVKVVTVDPVGGVGGRNDYFSLMRFNAANFAEAMK